MVTSFSFILWESCLSNLEGRFHFDSAAASARGNAALLTKRPASLVVNQSSTENAEILDDIDKNQPAS